MNEIKEFVFANWGEKVQVIDNVGLLHTGVIVEFDLSDKDNTKVVYEDGGFDWYNREYVEKGMKELELIKLELEQQNEKTII